MSFKNRIIAAFPVFSGLFRRAKPFIRQVIVNGAPAGDVSVSDVKKDDELVSVINLSDITDLTSEFKVSGNGAINNSGGTGTGTAATKATGQVTFGRTVTTEAVEIPIGTQVSATGGVLFETTAAGSMAIGADSVSVAVRAVVAGTSGNVAIGAIDTIVSTVDADTVTNAAATSGGAAATAKRLLVSWLAWGE